MTFFQSWLKFYLLGFTVAIFFFGFSIDVSSAQTCQLNTQQAYTNPNSSAVYYITTDCTKRPFKNPDVFFTYFDSWSKVKTTSQSTLNAIPDDNLGFMPWGPKKNFRSGVLVKTVEDPKTYILLKDQKCWIKSEQVFNELNYKWNWVTDVDPRLLDKYETCSTAIDYTDHHPVGTLIKYPDSKDVYVLKEHPNKEGEIVKKLIEDQQEFEQLGYRWDRIITIDESEQYSSSSELDGDKDSDESDTEVSSGRFQLSEDAVVARGDGTYTLSEGDAVVGDNQVGVKLENIRELDQNQKQEFGEDKYWVKFNFYADGKKITLKPVRFSGVFRANNSNKLYSLDVGYEASKSDIESGSQQVSVSIDSLDTRKVNNCRDLVDLCKQKGRDGSFCERKYCPTKATEGEQVFKDGMYTAVMPDQLEDIGGNVVDQMQVCHDKVKDQLQTDSSLDRVAVRFVYGSGSAKTTDIGIVWPIKRDEVQKEIDKWKDRESSSCESNLLAHELVHYFARGISMDDIFHEGVANLAAQKVTPDPSSNISCGQKGWSGNSPQSHASQSQVKCYQNCLPACYSSAKQVTIEQGGSYSIDDKKIVINKITPKKYWPDTNKTGSYHGEIKFTIKQNGGKLDTQTNYIGDLYDSHGIRFLPDGILIEKVVYPDRTEKTKKVRMRVYSEKKSGSPDYCSNSCKPLCQKRIEENTIKYSDLDNYLEVPWKPTFKMFYNTSQCLFSKAEDDYPEMNKEVIQQGKQAQKDAKRYCVGSVVESKVSQSTYSNLESIFGIGSECSWQVQRIANIDCWNKSCSSGRTIR